MFYEYFAKLITFSLLCCSIGVYGNGDSFSDEDHYDMQCTDDVQQEGDLEAKDPSNADSQSHSASRDENDDSKTSSDRDENMQDRDSSRSESAEDSEEENELVELVVSDSCQELQAVLDNEKFTLQDLKDAVPSHFHRLPEDCPLVFAAAHGSNVHLLRIVLQMIQEVGLEEYRQWILTVPAPDAYASWAQWALLAIEDPLMLFLLEAFGFITIIFPENRATVLQKVLCAILDVHTCFLEDYVADRIARGRDMGAPRIKTMEADAKERLTKLYQEAHRKFHEEQYYTLFEQRRESYLQSSQRYHIQTLDFLQIHCFWLFTEIDFPSIMDAVLERYVKVVFINANHALKREIHKEEGVYEPVTFKLYMEYLFEWMGGFRNHIHTLTNFRNLSLSDPRLVMALANLMWLEEVLMDDYQVVFQAVYNHFRRLAQFPQSILAFLDESRMDRSCHAFPNNPKGWLLSKNYYVAFKIFSEIPKLELEQLLESFIQQSWLFGEIFFASPNPFAAIFYGSANELAMPWYAGEWSYREDLDLGLAAKFIALFIHLVESGEITLTGCNEQRRAYAWLLEWLLEFFKRKGFLMLQQSSTGSDNSPGGGGVALALVNGDPITLGSPLNLRADLLQTAHHFSPSL